MPAITHLRLRISRIPTIYAPFQLFLKKLRADETNVAVYMRYTAFDLYLVEQSGLVELTDEARLDDLETMLSLNPEVSVLAPQDDDEPPY